MQWRGPEGIGASGPRSGGSLRVWDAFKQEGGVWALVCGQVCACVERA